MQKKNDCQKFIKNFRAKNGLEATDENLIATIHLMNTHGIDINAALDQSSRSSNDHGVDAWYYDEKDRTLFIYQSKLTESKTHVRKGFNDLISAFQKSCIDGFKLVIVGSADHEDEYSRNLKDCAAGNPDIVLLCFIGVSITPTNFQVSPTNLCFKLIEFS